jgi:Tfp pilus assembly protein FimT
MLVVIGITVLILAMAMPAFNFMTGSRSLEAAQNSVSAMLSRARSQAIYTGQPTGVAFYQDAKTQRYAMALVQYDTTPAGTNNIDLSPDQDPQMLQPGTAARGMVGQGNYSTPAIVMFDAQGRLANMQYTLNGTLATAYETTDNPTPVTSGYSQMALIIYDRGTFANQAAPATWLDTNGLMLVINRYNGTLLGSE